MGSITKVLSVEVENVPWRFCQFFTFGIVRWRVGRIAADFYPQRLKNRFLQPVWLLRIVTQLVEMLACLLPCSGVTDKCPLSRSFYAGPAKWRENNGAKMTSRSRKKVSHASKRNKTSQNHTSVLPELDCCWFEPKRRVWSAFRFPGTRNKGMYYIIQPWHWTSECSFWWADKIDAWAGAGDKTWKCKYGCGGQFSA